MCPAVTVTALLLGNLATCQALLWQVTPSVKTGGRYGGTLGNRWYSAKSEHMFGGRTSEGGDAAHQSGVSAATADRVVRPKVKPWPTKAQETVDYSNVEAM